ncbi:MAG TPA: nitrous oxide reductase, partial [Dehalococcoidia bacterium]|nr:nitrous oxide reductase [Dehalococcoidia bacterium]
MLRFLSWTRVAGALLVAVGVAACGKTTSQAGAAAMDAAAKVYVPPGQYDEFYMFTSGGFSGQVAVYGLPSGRLLRVIPVFSQDAEKGYGYSQDTRAMLNTSYGFIPWDDAHHPSLSMTDGEHDGRWLFINGNNTPRIARIDLSKMETEEIIEIPNAAGNHASPFTTQNTEYVVGATRFSVPTPQRDVPIAQYKEQFDGLISFVAVDPATGKLSLAFQIHMPGFDYDLARPGKGPSHGWAFFTSYNTEQANTLKERNASQNDKDF